MTQPREEKVVNFEFHKFNMKEEMEITQDMEKRFGRRDSEVRRHHADHVLHQMGKRVRRNFFPIKSTLDVTQAMENMSEPELYWKMESVEEPG